MDIEEPTLKIKSDSSALNEDKKLKTNDDRTKLKGQDDNLKNGQIKIYKNGKKYTTANVNGSGEWSKDISFGHDKEYKLKLKFFDQFGTLLNTKEYEVEIDTKKPTFTQKPNVQNQKITWKAEDENDIDYYKIKLLNDQGRILRKWKKQDKTWYIVPEVVKNEAKTMIVRAYDKAGNWEEEKMELGMETASSGQSAQPADPESGLTANVCSYTIQSGDTLRNISQKVHGNGFQYQEIIKHNPNINLDTLKIGQELKLGC